MVPEANVHWDLESNAIVEDTPCWMCIASAAADFMNELLTKAPQFYKKVKCLQEQWNRNYGKCETAWQEMGDGERGHTEDCSVETHDMFLYRDDVD